MFAKLLERTVQTDLIQYLLEKTNILTEHQYGFLPNGSSQEAVFEVTKMMYSGMNNRKVMGLIFLNVAKALNCHNERLYNKF